MVLWYRRQYTYHMGTQCFTVKECRSKRGAYQESSLSNGCPNNYYLCTHPTLTKVSQNKGISVTNH